MKFRISKRILCLLCGLCILCGLGSAMAQGVEMTAEIGYDGMVTYLRQLPLTVQITNHGSDTSGLLAVDIDRNEQDYDRCQTSLTIAAGATVDAVLPITLSTKQETYSVKWIVEGETVAETRVTPEIVMDPATLMVGVLSDDPQSLNYLNSTQSGGPLHRDEYWQTVALSPEIFPQERESLDFFDLLVVDGIDMTGFSDLQKQALDGWLNDGGIVLLSGGAKASAGFPFFAGYTGINAGALTQSDTVGEELKALLQLTGEAPEGSVSVVALDELLVKTTSVGSGLVMTAAFSLSEKTLTTWMGRNAAWQRLLLEYGRSCYQNAVSKRANQYYTYNYADSSALSYIPVSTSGAMLLPVVLLLLFVGLVGFGSYFLLKKLDKSDWMWLTVPVLALVFTLGIWGVSGMLKLQEPLMVSYTVVDVDQDGFKTSSTGLGVSSASDHGFTAGLTEGSLSIDDGSNYYYMQSEELAGAPKQLRTTFTTTGKQQTITLQNSTMWETSMFSANNVPLTDCGAQVTAGWEGKDMVFTLNNTGAIPLNAGVIFTDYGFVSTPEVLPGQTAQVRMLPADVEIETSSMIEDGMLLSETQRRQFSYYEYMERYRVLHRGDENLEATMALISSVANRKNWYEGIGMPCYMTPSDHLAEVEMTCDGETIRRVGQWDLLCVEAAFSPVSADGTVRFIGDSIPVSPAELNSQGKPQLSQTIVKGYGYVSYYLKDEPVFGFDMSAVPESWTLEGFDIVPASGVYYSYEVKLYRVTDGKWVSVKVHTFDQNTGNSSSKATLPDLSQYVDKSGMLYAQLCPSGKADDYITVNLPVLTMDGRLN